MPRILPAAPLTDEQNGSSGRQPGPYVAETFEVSVEDDYVVIDA